MGQSSLSYKMLYSDMHKHFIELGDHLVLYYNRAETMNEGRRRKPDPRGDSLIYEKPRGTPNKLPYNTGWRFPGVKRKKLQGIHFFVLNKK